MLKIQLIDRINPFEWEHFQCPLCGCREFTSVNHAGVYCDDCNCRFNVRDTAGDPGCVVDCYTTREDGGFTYAPAYLCEECAKLDYPVRHGLFDWQDKTCPKNLNHGQMTRERGISMPWKVTPGMERFCLVMKLGDYISGWSYGECFKKVSEFSPTQKQWDAFCEAHYEAREAVRD